MAYIPHILSLRRYFRNKLWDSMTMTDSETMLYCIYLYILKLTYCILMIDGESWVKIIGFGVLIKGKHLRDSDSVDAESFSIKCKSWYENRNSSLNDT